MPRIGVVKLGEVANATTVPEPVVEYDVPHDVPVELGIPAPGYTMPLGAAADTQVVPFEVSKLPFVPAATAEIDEPVPTKTPVAVASPVPPLPTGRVPVTLVVKFTKVVDVEPVPPLAIGSVPLTCVAKPILPQLGFALTPPDISALPTATSESLARDVVVSAYSKSPTA